MSDDSPSPNTEELKSEENVLAVETPASVEQEELTLQNTIEKEFIEEIAKNAQQESTSPASQDHYSGIEAILNQHLVHYERLPILEVVFDRLIRLLSTSLRNFTSDNVEVGFKGIQSIRFGDHLNDLQIPSMIGIFKVKEWDNYGLILADSALTYSIIDVLLGGRRSTFATRENNKTYTTIECNLIKKMMEIILSDLQKAFEPICLASCLFERLENSPRFASVVRPDNATLLIELDIDMVERGGKIQLMLPYATIEPIRELLLQNYMGEKFGRDSIWESHLAEQLWDTEISLEASFTPESFNLENVLKWTVGEQITFELKPQSPVLIHSADNSLFLGRMGQKDGKIAVQIDDILFKKGDRK